MPLPLAAMSLAGSVAGAATEAMRRAAGAFESQAFSQLLGPAFASVDPSKGPFGGGSAEAQWRPMLVDAMAGAAVRAGQGLGLGDAVLREMLRAQAAGQAAGQPGTPGGTGVP